MSVAAAGSMSAGIEPRPQLILLPGLLCDADLGAVAAVVGM
jgi:hypothetical protein